MKVCWFLISEKKKIWYVSVQYCVRTAENLIQLSSWKNRRYVHRNNDCGVWTEIVARFPWGGDSQMKRAGMLAGKFEFNPWGMEGRGQSYSVCRAGWGKEDKHAYLHSRLSLLAKRAGFHSKKRWRWRCTCWIIHSTCVLEVTDLKK